MFAFLQVRLPSNSTLLTNTITRCRKFFQNSLPSHCSLFSPDNVQFSKIVQSCQADLTASVFLTCLHGGLLSHVILCVTVCMFHACQGWIRLVVCVCVCVIPPTHLTGRGEGLQQSWQCMTKCPPVNLPEWSWLLQWGRADETKHMWARDRRAMEEAGLDVSISLAGGHGNFCWG